MADWCIYKAWDMKMYQLVLIQFHKLGIRYALMHRTSLITFKPHEAFTIINMHI